MENASKALLIAGTILIAILLISVLLRMYNGISGFKRTQLSEEEQAELTAFNEQYIKYLDQYVYGTEVLSLQNKYASDSKVKVTIKSEDNSNFSDTQYYKCTGVEYNLEGMINNIIFKQVKLKAEILNN